MANRTNDDILEIVEVGLTVELVDRGLLEPNQAKEVIGGYIEQIREGYGGERYMIRRGYRRYSPAMKRRIASEFNGSNAPALIARYGISTATFYRAVKKYS
ncbi:MAG: Mor transcription activator family protein [Woeseiaceae bacterium]